LSDEKIRNIFDQNCPSRRVIEIVTAKWVVIVIHALEDKTCRYNDLLHMIGGISQKMLTQTLHSLEADGLVEKLAGNSLHHVEYSLAPFGKTLTEPLSLLCRWAEAHLDEIGTVRKNTRRSNNPPSM
jgi:DNA-binding HxlR family transcriptional regulator